jgi:hypothetical protein
MIRWNIPFIEYLSTHQYKNLREKTNETCILTIISPVIVLPLADDASAALAVTADELLDDACVATDAISLKDARGTVDDTPFTGAP